MLKKLTMVAIAKELYYRHRTEAAVWLAVGLPLIWYGEQKERFARYLSQVRYRLPVKSLSPGLKLTSPTV